MKSSHHSCRPTPNLKVKFPVQAAASAPLPYRPHKLSDANFTQIPNLLFNLVLQGKLLARDLVTYAALFARSGIAMQVKGQDYIFFPEKDFAEELICSVRTLRASLARLLKAGIIERLDTPGLTRTRVLLYVENGGEIVRRLPMFAYAGTKPKPAPTSQALVANNENDFDNPFPSVVHSVVTGDESPPEEAENCLSITLDSLVR